MPREYVACVLGVSSTLHQALKQVTDDASNRDDSPDQHCMELAVRKQSCIPIRTQRGTHTGRNMTPSACHRLVRTGERRKLAGGQPQLATQLAGEQRACVCLLYTSDAADEEDSVDLGGRRIIKKKKKREIC
eukprot:TRINITY_DN3214_c0_g2_i1.p1 TRINITY_DN3214_c0_g2~~TRINITY_DN3214_c0_g2_i1.p1  ORF type:complete len:132 (-),score=27.42 TRINITY_DN3214_c0_g2_i1:114-509(-)